MRAPSTARRLSGTVSASAASPCSTTERATSPRKSGLPSAFSRIARTSDGGSRVRSATASISARLSSSPSGASTISVVHSSVVQGRCQSGRCVATSRIGVSSTFSISVVR